MLGANFSSHSKRGGDAYMATSFSRAAERPLEDVRYELERGVAWITIARPERYNAFRGQTVDELLHCFKLAWADGDVGVVVLTGEGDRAFCAGGDQKQRAETGDYGPTDYGLFEVEQLHRIIRAIPKPVIAAVNGVAIGGGHVLHVLADITIAADHAIFGQNGPRVGSFDAGFGTSYLARVVGEKRAREIWFLCRRYDAATADRWGLVNRVVPLAELRAEVRRWADEILALSPTSLRFLKQSFNADSEHIAGVGSLAFSGLHQFVDSAEAREGVQAFAAKREPDFAPFRASVSA
jgi:2-ketocyclohexanecarboxyl-CoA hydrolase